MGMFNTRKWILLTMASKFYGVLLAKFIHLNLGYLYACMHILDKEKYLKFSSRKELIKNYFSIYLVHFRIRSGLLVRSDPLHWLLHICMCAHLSNGHTFTGNLDAVKWKKKSINSPLNSHTVSLRRHFIFVGFCLILSLFVGEETSQGTHSRALSWREAVNSLQDKVILASSPVEKGFLVLVMEVEYDSFYFTVPLDRKIGKKDESSW